MEKAIHVNASNIFTVDTTARSDLQFLTGEVILERLGAVDKDIKTINETLANTIKTLEENKKKMDQYKKNMEEANKKMDDMMDKWEIISEELEELEKDPEAPFYGGFDEDE